MDTRKLVQFFKSKLHITLTFTESRYRYRRHRVTEQNPSRGSNRYVEELQCNDPDYSPESHELANYTSVGKPHAILSSTEKHVRHSQSNLMSNHSKDFSPVDERKWSDISAFDDVRGNTLECRISKWVTKLVPHIDLKDRETDGAVHWKSMGRKLRHAFQKQGGSTSLILNSMTISGREAIKLGFKIASIPTTFSFTFAPCKGILEEN